MYYRKLLCSTTERKYIKGYNVRNPSSDATDPDQASFTANSSNSRVFFSFSLDQTETAWRLDFVNKSQVRTITSSQLRRLQTSLLRRMQCQFMTCILSALSKSSCELNGRGPYYSEAGRKRIRSTELSTGSSASVSVHGRVPQQFSPYGQLK